jgi:predicted secreted hydrolase
MQDQELDLSFNYWEGAVAAEGTIESRAPSGHGYAELTGYTKRGIAVPEKTPTTR